MGGPSPYPAAALPSVPVQPGFGLLQVGGRSQSQTAAVLNRPDHFTFDGSAYRPRNFNPPLSRFIRSDPPSFGTPALEPVSVCRRGLLGTPRLAPGSTLVVRTVE